MSVTRLVAFRKASEGFLQVLQRGKVIEHPSESTVKGIIRLRLRIPDTSGTTTSALATNETTEAKRNNHMENHT